MKHATKRKKLGKKGIFFDIMIILVFLIVMTYALLSFADKNRKVSNERTIGELEFNMLKVVQEPEKTLVYLDEAAKYSLIKAAYNLSEKGGTQKPICGDFKGYTLWTNETKSMGECFPNYVNEMKRGFGANLDMYIVMYNANVNSNPKEGGMPFFAVNNYEYRIIPSSSNLKIQGFAKENLAIEGNGVKYSVKPNFEAVAAYNLYEYENLKDTVIGIINSCYPRQTGDELDNCVQNEMVSPFRVANHEGRTYAIEYTSTRLLFEEKPITYKFAFYIQNNSAAVPLIRPPKLVESPSPMVVEGLNQIYSLQHQIDSNLTKAIIQQESGGNANAIRCEQSYEKRWKDLAKDCLQYGCNGLIDSPQGRFHKVSCSYGLMQLMYPTAMDTCKDIVTTPESLFDPVTNVECGTRYLKKMLDQCKDPKRAIYAYNHGPANCKTADVESDQYVASVVSHCNALGGCALA